ncbi:hypothetical protein C8Q80DRAFT_442999 [Daedaleopsis nitida]|nr:hypothetical protein C8Q80DRAFT_442999 [Daedaleopsis nitida]
MASFLILHSPSPQMQCVPTTFSWDGGIPPYTLRITADSSAGIGDTLQTFSGINGMSLQWPANLPGGTQFGIVLRDSTPITVQFEPVTMENGTDLSCLESSSSSSSLGTTSASQTSTSSTSDTASSSTTAAQSSSSVASGTGTEAGSNTGTPDSVLSSSSTSLSPGAIAGIAVGAALGGCLCAVVGFWLWKRARANRRRRNRMTALNESTLTPWQPPPTPSNKAAMMRESLLSTSAPASSSQGHMLAASPSPTSAVFARYPSGVSSEQYPATPHTPPSPSGTGEGSAFLHAPASRRARYSAVGSISTIGEESPSVYSARLGPAAGGSSRHTAKSRPASSLAPSAAGADVRVSVQESDAGVRLAGGPPPVEEREGTEEGAEGEGATVPPPYHRYD